jgi:lysophospholipase L1-like esterase
MAYTTGNFQAETQDFLNRIVVAGGQLDAATTNALDKFILAGKRDGWYSVLHYIAPFCGNNLASALVLLKAPAGVAFTATSFADADFDNAKGLTATTAGQYLLTGYVPVTQGLTVTNFTMAAARLGFTRSNTAVFVSSVPATGEGSPMIDYNTAGISRSNQTVTCSGGQRHTVLVGRSSSYAGFTDGVKLHLTTVAATPTANTLQYEMTVFRGNTPDGVTNNSIGTIGMLCFGPSLTDAQATSLNKAMMQFTYEVRTWFCKKGLTFSVLGDSNGQEWQAGGGWGAALSREYGWREWNHAQAGSRMNGDASGTLSGLNRYLNIIANNPEMCFIALGTNDAQNDGQTNGSSTTANTLTTNLNTVCAAFRTSRIKTFIIGVPWASVINTTKGALYNAAAASSAKTSAVPFVDLYNLFNDTGSASSFFVDGIHFNGTGYTMVADAIKERLQGKMFRVLNLDFPSIAANSQADLTVTIYNAVAGMPVNVTPLSAPEAGLIPVGFVSANDTVTVRMTNTTGAAIDPASIQYRVTVFANY